MQQKKFFAGALVTVGALALFSGCQQAAPATPAKPPEEVIKEGMTKLTDVTSYAYEVALNADVKDPTTGAVKFDVTLGGAMDVKDKKDPKITLKMDGSGSDDKGEGGSGSFEVRLNKDAVFFNLMKLELKGSQAEAIPAEVKEMMSKWWKITLPPGALDEVSASLPQGSMEEMTPEQKEMKKAFEDAKIFTNPTLVGTESVKGENSYHYTVTVDKKALAAFVAKAATMQGETMSEGDLKEMEAGLAQLDVKADVWVGQTSGVMNQMSGTMNLKADASGATGVIGFRLTLSDINKPVTVTAPADATEFPVEEFLGPLMMGMSGGMDPSMMDPSAGTMLPGGVMDPTMVGGDAMVETSGDTTVEVQ
jgi:hypothetical protein